MPTVLGIIVIGVIGAIVDSYWSAKEDIALNNYKNSDYYDTFIDSSSE